MREMSNITDGEGDVWADAKNSKGNATEKILVWKALLSSLKCPYFIKTFLPKVAYIRLPMECKCPRNDKCPYFSDICILIVPLTIKDAWSVNVVAMKNALIFVIILY